MAFSIGSRPWSIEYGHGEVVDMDPNGNIGVRFLNKHKTCDVPESIIEWYNSRGERVARIQTSKTLFSFPQEILPLHSGSII